jgi:hypothetical protein
VALCDFVTHINELPAIFRTMLLKRTFENLLYTIPIIIISNIIYIFYTSKFPGGVAGMQPFVLIFNSFISFILSFIIYFFINIKYKLNPSKSIVIFILISFLTLIYFGANPFNHRIEIVQRDLNLWLYISILIPSFLVFVRNIIVEKY